MLKKLIAFVLCLFILLQFTGPAAALTSTAPKMVYDEFADILVTADSRDFNVHLLKKQFSTVPFIDGKVTYTQVEAILPWLGYTVSYDRKTKIMTASATTQKCSITADSLAYKVNGKAYKFSKAPKETSGRLMVPVEELFKTLGYNIQSDRVLKTVRISKFKDYLLRNFVFYNKSKESSNFYWFDRRGLYNAFYEDMIINQMYCQDGVVLGYVYDRRERMNKLVRVDSGRFVDIKEDFDMVGTYEFGSSRVFYGYDNADKKYKLYRFKGKSLTLVVDDCYSSTHVNFKNNIILNKYDSARNYSIVRISEDWTITEMDSGKTMTEYSISDSWLYIKEKPQERTGLYFLFFDGASTLKANASAGLSKPVNDIKFVDIRVCAGKAFAILPTEAGKRKLYQLEETRVTRMSNDPCDGVIDLMEAYNGKLYLSFNYRFKNYAHYGLYEYTPGANYYTVNGPIFNDRNIKFDKSRVEGGALFLNGKVGDNGSTPNEDVMYVLKGGTWNYAMDIKSLESVIETPNGLVLKVKDFDRSAPGVVRDSVLFVDNYTEISNIAIDFTIANQSVVGDTIYFAGTNKITKRSCVSSLDTDYSELIRGYTVSYWTQVKNRIFTGGSHESLNVLYTILGTSSTALKNDFSTSLVYGTSRPGLYLVFGIERDKTSIYYNTKVFYLYDMSSRTFTLVTAGIDIEQFLMYN